MSLTDFPSAKPIVLDPLHEADACVIWLHGLGADGHDFEPIVPELGLPPEHGVRFVFPNAPTRQVTVNLGQTMTAWYDIYQLDLLAQVDWSGIVESVEYVHQLIAEQLDKGIASDRILLAGFSQGGVIALYSALSFQSPLAGVLAMSTYFPGFEQAPAELSLKQPQSCPVFFGHGTSDPICPFAAAETSREVLRRLGLAVEWHAYPMAHQVCLDEIADISRFIRQRLFA